MSTMPINLTDVTNECSRTSFFPFPSQEASSCDLLIHNETTQKVSILIQEKETLPAENCSLRSLKLKYILHTPFSLPNISLDPLEKKTVTISSQIIHNPFSVFKGLTHREFHIQTTSRNYIDCISSISVPLQSSTMFFVDLKEDHLPASHEDRFISAKMRTLK